MESIPENMFIKYFDKFRQIESKQIQKEKITICPLNSPRYSIRLK